LEIYVWIQRNRSLNGRNEQSPLFFAILTSLRPVPARPPLSPRPPFSPYKHLSHKFISMTFSPLFPSDSPACSSSFIGNKVFLLSIHILFTSIYFIFSEFKRKNKVKRIIKNYIQWKGESERWEGGREGGSKKFPQKNNGRSNKNIYRGG